MLDYIPRHEDVCGNEGIAPRILNLGTRWRWVVSFKPRPLYPLGMSHRYPLDIRLGGLQNLSGRGGDRKKKIPLLPLRELNPSRPARSLVTKLTELVPLPTQIITSAQRPLGGPSRHLFCSGQMKSSYCMLVCILYFVSTQKARHSNAI
jgi:hypothetical protein